MRTQACLLRLGLLAAALGACHKNGDKGPKEPTAAAATSAVAGKAAVTVRVADLQTKVSPRTVLVDAPLAGIKQADVYAKVTGRVTYLGPKEGAPVKAGDLLFRVDRSDPGDSFLNMPMPSPLSGWVGMWRVTNIGEQVTPTEPVVTIVDDRTLRTIAYLPAEDWTYVTTQTKVTAVLNGQERTGKVVSIARSADLSSGRGSVTVEIPNAERDWRAGMYARLRFELQPKERLLLSSAALIITDLGAYVYLTEGDNAHRVPVHYRVVDPDTVEITSGLPRSGKVVVAGANLLSDKSQVRIIE